jgi:hypothetical protein
LIPYDHANLCVQPVNFAWFERKVKEWGCMQALIDFDGWRKWEDFATENGLKDPRDVMTGPRASATRRREVKTPAPAPTNNSTTNLAHIAANNLTASLPHHTALTPGSSTTNDTNSAITANAKSNDTTAREDFATTAKSSIGETLVSWKEGNQSVKEDSPDTIVGISTAKA